MCFASVLWEMHALAAAIQTPVSDHDDDLHEETAKADILEDINTLVSQIHTSLRLQNLLTRTTSTQQCVDVLPQEDLDHNTHAELDVSENLSVCTPESDSADEHGVVRFDSDESVVGFKSDTEESDIQDRERQHAVSELLIRSDQNHVKRIRALYYECRWKNQEWPHTDVLSIQGLANVLRHYIEPEDIPTPARCLAQCRSMHCYRNLNA